MIKMKSNKKKITMAIGMVLGVTVLAGATFASYSTSNGYDVAKTAVKVVKRKLHREYDNKDKP